MNSVLIYAGWFLFAVLALAAVSSVVFMFRNRWPAKPNRERNSNRAQMLQYENRDAQKAGLL